jgi:hypothetical protein
MSLVGGWWWLDCGQAFVVNGFCSLVCGDSEMDRFSWRGFGDAIAERVFHLVPMRDVES